MKLFCVIILIIFVLKESIATYEQQFLGDYLTDEEYENREKCESKLCIFDGDELFSVATQNSSIRPCDDFSEFAMGTFFKYRALNERYPATGFIMKMLLLQWERNRQILKRPVHEADPNVFKVLKNYFRKCANSDLIREDGVEDITSYLMQLGGSPLLSNGSWNDEAFNIPKLFIREPDLATKLFLGQHLSRCIDPRNISREILCFKSDVELVPSDTLENEITYLLKFLRKDPILVEIGVKRFMDFMQKQEIIRNETKFDVIKITSIKDLNKHFPMLPINWLELINSQMLRDSQVTGEEKILIENPQMMETSATLLMQEDIRTISDAFALSFLLNNRETFIVYPFSQLTVAVIGTEKSYQRSELCIDSCLKYMKSAMDALLIESYFDKDVQDSVRTFAMEAVADFTDEFKKLKIDNEKAKENVIEKLESIKYSIMGPDESFDKSKIVEMYEELDVDGSESVLKMYSSMERLYSKTVREESRSWKKKLLLRSQRSEARYFMNENILNIPIIYTFYPAYHTNRSRFFNTATLYQVLLFTLDDDVKKYLKEKYNVRIGELISQHDLVDKNYMRWEANGGRDLHLSAFKLTNRQMLWLAMAHVLIHKLRISPRNSALQLYLDHFNLKFKETEHFREVFGCEKTNYQGKEMLKKYKESKFDAGLKAQNEE